VHRRDAAAALAVALAAGLLAACGSPGTNSATSRGHAHARSHTGRPKGKQASRSTAAGGRSTSTTQPASANGVTTTTGGTSAKGSNPPLASGQQGTVTAIPWSAVGPGWLLATWSPNPPSQTASSTSNTSGSLFLVDPNGGRYLVTKLSSPIPHIVAWSGDGRHALLAASSGHSGTKLREIDVTNGHTVDTLSAGSGNVASATFTRPNGLAILANSGTEKGSTPLLARYGLNGTMEQTYPTVFGEVGAYDGLFVPSPDGSQIVMGASAGFAVVSNNGDVTAQVRLAGGCIPLHWWSSGVVLTSCTITRAGLWQVPLSGALPTALTVAPLVPPDTGDADAWQVPSGTYVQDLAACGSKYLAQLQPNGTTSPVSVPQVDSGDGQVVLGTNSGLIGLQTTGSCGGPGLSALWFDPSTGTSSVVLGPPLNGGSVLDAVAFQEPNT
jgi:hypothetical protein